MKVLLVIGTRPQIIKSVPVVHEARRRGIDLSLIHTGQHYDDLMSDVFFRAFSLPLPSANLGVGSGSQGHQIGEIIMRLEKVITDNRPDLVIVPGDTNSALASALVAAKSGIALAHIEAGARSYDMKMQEEINRRVVDHISSVHFAVSERCRSNLLRENVLGKVLFTGDTMFEVYSQSYPSIMESDIIDRLRLEPQEYVVLTIHREENTEDAYRLLEIFKAARSLDMKVVFPVHPRTRNKLNQMTISAGKGNLVMIDPLDYFSMMKLVKESRLVITDSGGLQKEAFWSHIPCVTLRASTEWVETIEQGVNLLSDWHEPSIIRAAKAMMDDRQSLVLKFGRIENPYVKAEHRPSEEILDQVASFQELHEVR